MVDLTGETESLDEDLDESEIEEKEEEARLNRMYLAFSWWLLNKGWVALSEQVKDAVIRVFGPYVCYYFYAGLIYELYFFSNNFFSDI